MNAERPTSPGHYFVDTPDRIGEHPHVVFLDENDLVWGIGVATPLDWPRHLLTNWRPMVDKDAAQAISATVQDLKETISNTYVVAANRMYKLAKDNIELRERLKLAVEAMRYARRSTAFDDGPSDGTVVTRQAAAQAIDGVLIDHLVEDRARTLTRFIPAIGLPSAHYWTMTVEDKHFGTWQPRLYENGQIEGRPASDFIMGDQIPEHGSSCAQLAIDAVVAEIMSYKLDAHPISVLTALNIAEALRGWSSEPEDGGSAAMNATTDTENASEQVRSRLRIQNEHGVDLASIDLTTGAVTIDGGLEGADEAARIFWSAIATAWKFGIEESFKPRHLAPKDLLLRSAGEHGGDILLQVGRGSSAEARGGDIIVYCPAPEAT